MNENDMNQMQAPVQDMQTVPQTPSVPVPNYSRDPNASQNLTQKPPMAEAIQDKMAADNPGFDIPIVDGFADTPEMKKIGGSYSLNAALSAQAAGKSVTEKQNAVLTDFMLNRLMPLALGDDGMEKLSEHFDDDAEKMVGWFSGKLTVYSASRQAV